MTKEKILEHVKCGREIEFVFNGKKYSITYGTIDGQDVISFCEFYQESTEVQTAEDLLLVERDGKTVLEMLESTSDNSIWIY